MAQIPSEGGEHLVKTGESWFSIARQQLGGEANESQVAAYAQEIARVNGGLTVLRSNRTIRLPQTVVGENARPTTEFMAAARGELSSYRAGTFDPTGEALAPVGASQNTVATPPRNGQSIYPSHPTRQPTVATPTGFGGQLVNGRYIEAGARPIQTGLPSGGAGASGVAQPDYSRGGQTGNVGSMQGLQNLVRGALTPVFAPGSPEDRAFQSLQSSLSQMREANLQNTRNQTANARIDEIFGTRQSQQQPSQTSRQMTGANMTQEQLRGMQIAAQQHGGNLPSPQTQLAELSYAMAQGSLPPAIYATVAYGAGLSAEALIARGYEFTNTGYWVYAQDDIEEDFLPETQGLFDSSPMGSGINPGYYGAPLGLEEYSYGGGDVNGGWTPGAYSNPYSGRVGSSNISWRIGIS